MSPNPAVSNQGRQSVMDGVATGDIGLIGNRALGGVHAQAADRGGKMGYVLEFLEKEGVDGRHFCGS
jgi:hypothetical protein